MPRDDRTDTYNPVWIDGSRALKDPIRIGWEPASRGTAGTGEPLFSQYWSCRLEIGVCTETQFNWWYGYRTAGGEHTLQTSHPDATVTNPDYPGLDYVYAFSGTYFRDLTWSRRDEFYYDVTADFSHILVP